MSLRTVNLSTSAACITNAILGTASWIIAPDLAMQWVVSVAFLPIVMIGLLIVGRLQLCRHYSRTQWQQAIRGVALAGWLISVSLGFGLVKMLGWIEPSLASKLAGASFAFIVMVEGNRIPKVLMPLDSTRHDPVATQHLQRFAGWLLALAGFLSLIVWMFTPLRLALVVVPSIGVGAIFAIVLHAVFRHARHASKIRRCGHAQRTDASPVATAAAASSSSIT